MTTSSSTPSRSSRVPWSDLHPVVAVGLLLVVLQLAVRAWASYGSWFLYDDFEMLSRLYQAPLTLTELFTPHDQQLMPGGIFFAWLMANAGPQNWFVGASILVFWQAIASTSCLAMLVVVFGRRWQVLPLLVLYLASPMTLTAFMWWLAAMNQIPLHASFFLTVIAAVKYFRTRRLVWLGLAVLAVMLGLGFFVKALLFLPVMAAVALLFFAPEAPTSRTGVRGRAQAAYLATRGTLKRYAPMWAVFFVLGAVYSTYYRSKVPSPFSGVDVEWLGLADNMFRLSFGPALLGGPWQWWNPIPPTGLVDTPAWAAAGAWLAIALAAIFLRRVGGARWRALLILAGYLATSYVLAGVGRAFFVGEVVGLELRYLADAMPVVVLCLGLLLFDARAPLDSPRTGTPSLPSMERRHLTVLVVTVVLVASAGLSTVRFVDLWHVDYKAKAYTRNVAEGARLHDLRLVDEVVPPDVMNPLDDPANYVSRMFSQFPNIDALTEGNDLAILDEFGYARLAEVRPALSSRPGPAANCGYLVRDKPREIDLRTPSEAVPLEPTWWVSVDYVAGDDTVLRARFGGIEGDYPVMKGPHTLLVKGSGAIESVTLSVDLPGVVLCIDEVRVGKVQQWQL